MNKNDIRKLQLAQLQLLKYVDKICRENKIKYYVVFGSLIGVLRHKGFIPWDADVDIAMFRTDYEKFCKLMINNSDERLFFDHYTTNKNHNSPHALLKIKGTHIYGNYRNSKIYSSETDGIFIDIFPLDKISDNPIKQNKLAEKILFLRRISSWKRERLYPNTSKFKKLLKKIVAFVLKPISLSYINGKIDKYIQVYNNTDTNIVGFLTDPDYHPTLLYNKECFGWGRTGMFEGYEFPIPYKSEEILEKYYGDFMQYPPEDEKWSFWERGIFESVDYGEYEENLKL